MNEIKEALEKIASQLSKLEGAVAAELVCAKNNVKAAITWVEKHILKNPAKDSCPPKTEPPAPKPPTDDVG